jgi:hypothetical protein
LSREARPSKPQRKGTANPPPGEATPGSEARSDPPGSDPRSAGDSRRTRVPSPPASDSVAAAQGPPIGASPPFARNAALAAVLALALGIRVWKLGYGLPEFLDEALPFRWALAMWSDPGGRIDWNPHRFHHPSLPTYLHLLVQQAGYLAGRMLGAYKSAADYHLGFLVDPTAMALAARAVGVAADLATVIAVALLAERIRRGTGWLAALLVACSPTFVGAARSICSDSVMVPLATAALERTLAYRERGGRARFVAAAVMIGLAAGSKYPAAILLVPLGVALWLRGGMRGLWLWPLAAAISGAVFLATTPYALLDFATFQRDLGFVRGLAQKGHLGNLGESGFLFHLRNLARDISWPGVVLLIVSLAWTARRPRARADAALVWLALLAFGLPIAFARVEAERYLLPLLPLAAVLVAELVAALAQRIPRAVRAPGLAAAALVLAGPALAASARLVIASATDSRIAARRWVEAHLSQRDFIVQEYYCAPLLGRMEWLTARSGALYGAASPALQRRYDARRWFSSARLPLAVVGTSSNRVKPPSGPAVDIEVFPHAADFNRLVYEPRFLQRVDYFATSSAVRARFEADTARYDVEHRFYALLDSTAEVAARFRPQVQGGGPEIVLYRLGDRAQAALARLGALDPLWWAETIPPGYRERAGRVLEPGRAIGPAVRLADGSPAAWVLSLKPVYQYLLSDFALAMGAELADRERFAEARRFATATLVVAPEDAQACVLYVECCARLGDWGAARAVVERSLMALAVTGDTSRTLRLTYGEVLLKFGDRAGARREFEALAGSGDEIGAEARRRLESLR